MDDAEKMSLVNRSCHFINRLNDLNGLLKYKRGKIDITFWGGKAVKGEDILNQKLIKNSIREEIKRLKKSIPRNSELAKSIKKIKKYKHDRRIEGHI